MGADRSLPLLFKTSVAYQLKDIFTTIRGYYDLFLSAASQPDMHYT